MGGPKRTHMPLIQFPPPTSSIRSGLDGTSSSCRFADCKRPLYLVLRSTHHSVAFRALRWPSPPPLPSSSPLESSLIAFCPHSPTHITRPSYCGSRNVRSLLWRFTGPTESAPTDSQTVGRSLFFASLDHRARPPILRDGRPIPRFLLPTSPSSSSSSSSIPFPPKQPKLN